MTRSERRGPRQDITVIDCTRALAGPYGTSLLAALGARVVKVEAPLGDGYRNTPPLLPDYASAYVEQQAGTDFGGPFAAVNRNKRRVCLDLKDTRGRNVFLQLCDQADAVVENTRAGVMARLNGGIPAGPVHYMADIFPDPHVAARGMLETCDPGAGKSAHHAGRQPDQVQRNANRPVSPTAKIECTQCRGTR